MKEMITPYINNNTISTRDIACDICNMFEGLLDKYDIDIPDDDRESDDSEAHLYGTNYGICEDSICELLDEIIKSVILETKNGKNINITDNYNNTIGNFITPYSYSNK